MKTTKNDFVISIKFQGKELTYTSKKYFLPLTRDNIENIDILKENAIYILSSSFWNEEKFEDLKEEDKNEK